MFVFYFIYRSLRLKIESSWLYGSGIYPRYDLIMIMLLCITGALFAQDTTTSVQSQEKFINSLSMTIENGSLLGRGKDLAEQLGKGSYYNGLDLTFGWTNIDPDNIYGKIYRLPTYGIGYYISTFHTNVIGNPNALFFKMNIPIMFEGNRKFTASYISAFGLSFNFNPYDSIYNPNNTLIGSSVNCYFHIGLNLNFHINNKLTFFGSGGFKHFSNGTLKVPNKGLNMAQLSAGIKYNFADKPVNQPNITLPGYIKHNQYNLMLAIGGRSQNYGEPNYLKLTLGGNYLRQISYKYRLGIGLDFFYSANSDLRIDSDESSFSKSVSSAVVGSWEWVLNRTLTIPIGLGYYVHRNIENGEIEKYYERIGLRVRISDHYNLGVTIKAHADIADIFEWTFAYTFHKDPNKYR